MIKYFTVENFRSIKNETILEFDTNIPQDAGFETNPVIGFAGANASGKTTILQALTFTLWFMQNSFFSVEEGEKIPVETFVTQQKNPISFQLIFAIPTTINGQQKYIDYDYQLQLTPEKVIYEQLRYAPIRKGNWRDVYTRTENSVKFGQSIKQIKATAWKDDLRDNSSIISFMAQFGSQTVAKTCKNYGFYSNVNVSGYREIEFHPGYIQDLLQDVITQDKLQTFLQIADVGISNITVQESDREEILKLLQELEPQQVEMLKTALRTDETKENVYIRVIFEHYIDDGVIEFDTSSESSGTLRFLAILYLILNALKNGDVIILDEIELKLHQNLVAYLIGLFQNKYENPNGAQLFFSFHNTYLMDILTPKQLWFTEKNQNGDTEVFSAIDFEDLRNLQKRSLETLYRIGRFGATPRGI